MRVLVAIAVGTLGCGRIAFDAVPQDGLASSADDGALTIACDTSPNLVGYWPFDEDTGTIATDRSRKRQDASMTGAPTWRAGKIGNALDFDGIDDGLALPAGAGVDIGVARGGFSIAFWLEPASLTNGVIIRPFEAAFCTGSAYVFSGIATDGTINLGGYDSDGGPISFAETISNAGALQLGTWVHVAMVVDRSTMTGRTYIDGMPPTRTDPMPGWDQDLDCSAAQTVAIGGFSSFFFAGAMDDVRIYDRALTDSDVAELASLTSSDCPF